jgi:hypothetical protein
MKPQLYLCAGPVLSISQIAFGQANFNGTYFQDFNSLGQGGTATIAGPGPHAINGVLGSTGMDGWYGANFFGSSTSTEFKAHNGSLGSSAGRGVVFFGAEGSSERAVGALPTSNQIPSFGVVLTNETPEAFQSLNISFIGEQWRAGGVNIPNVLSFRYGFGTSLTDAATSFSALNFAAPILSGGEIALNGNDPANQIALSSVLTNLNWAPGQSLVLRWDIADLSGQDNGLAIDNLSLEGVVPAPGAMGLLGVLSICGIRSRNRRR